MPTHQPEGQPPLGRYPTQDKPQPPGADTSKGVEPDHLGDNIAEEPDPGKKK